MTRDEKGRFIKGVSGNPKGRSPREVEEDYRAILVSNVTKEDWAQIVKRAVVDAKKGDTAARKFIADYLIGLPVQRQEHTGADGNALKILVEYVGNETSEFQEPGNFD